MMCALVKCPIHVVVIFNNAAQLSVTWHINLPCGLFSAKLLHPTPEYFETNMLAFIKNNVSNLSSI